MKKLFLTFLTLPILVFSVEQDVTLFDIPPIQRASDLVSAYQALNVARPSTDIAIDLKDGSFILLSANSNISNPIQPAPNGTIIIIYLSTNPVRLRSVFIEDIVGIRFTAL